MGSWSALNRLGPVAVAAIHLRAELRCTHCGCRTLPGRRQVDHVVPRCDGGGDEPTNLVLACSDCNSRRTPGLLTPRARRYGRTQEQVRAEIKRQTSIEIGPESDIYARALDHARLWWPDQFERRARARAAYLARSAMSFFEELAA